MKKLGALIDRIKDPKNRKTMFKWYIIYQAIKGMLTLSFIWIPLLYVTMIQ